MIEIKNLTKKFGPNIVLDDISFKVEKGDILGFLGPNGAGKSTTMKIITSFWSPNKGSVLVDGIDVAEDSIATRSKIGYLPENVPLYDDMRVYEYLKFIAEMRGISADKAKDRIKQVVADIGLKKMIRKPIEELSKGYRQRVGLAQAIMHDPEILILDEPTTGLDPNQIVEIRELIKKIGQEKTIIFSTHILSEVEATCNRAIIINNGKIAIEGHPSELLKKAGGRELIYVKIKGPEGQIKQAIEGMAEVAKVLIKDKEANDIHGFEISPKEGVDLREQLSNVVMKNGWSILEFKKIVASFEDVFRELTK